MGPPRDAAGDDRRIGFPSITIVMPSFNQAPYIEESIRSVLDQGYSNLELIIIDGGSDDGTPTLIKRFDAEVAYWQTQPDRGQSHALRQGFARATGDLMGWLNSDDVLLSGALSTIAQLWLRRPDADVFGGNNVVLNQRGQVSRCKHHPSAAPWFSTFGLQTVLQPGSFFTRRAYESVGGIREELRYVMDTDLYLRLFAAGWRYAHVDKWLAGFRLHPRSKTIGEAAGVRQEYAMARRSTWSQYVRSPIACATGRPAYRVWQSVNGNYLRTAIDTLRFRGRRWDACAQLHPRRTGQVAP